MVGTSKYFTGSKGDLIISNAYFGKHLILKGTSKYMTIINDEIVDLIVKVFYENPIPAIEREKYAIVYPPESEELVKKAIELYEKIREERFSKLKAEEKRKERKEDKKIRKVISKIENPIEKIIKVFEIQTKEIEEIEKVTDVIEEEVEIPQFLVFEVFKSSKNWKVAFKFYLALMHPSLQKQYPISFKAFKFE